MLKEKGIKKALRARWFQLARWVCKVFCIMFFHLRVYGKENIPAEGAFLLVGNHQSYLDPIFCGVPLKRHLYFVARDSLFANCFFGRLLSSVNVIPVKLGKADLSAMKRVIAELKEGNAVCLFPEATRSSDGKISSLKAGFSLLCRRSEAAIVPVLIDGAFECWPRHKRMFSPGQIVVRYGQCITAEQAKNMSGRKLAEVLTDTLRRMQTQSRLKHGKEPYNY